MARHGTLPTPTGTLVAWGGGDDEPLLDLLAARLVGRLTGGVEVLPAATPRRPLATGQAYVNSLRRRGFQHVGLLHFTPSRPADTPAYLKRLTSASLIFLSGGDQERLTAALLGTHFLELLRERFRAGELVVAGTSAGAAALPDQMIVSGYGYRSLLAGRVRTAPGLGLLPGCLLDQHFTERGRFARLAHAILRDPGRLGLGLGEETGLWIEHGQATVIGEAVVTLIDGRRSSAPTLAMLPDGHPISGTGLRLDLLTAGQTLLLGRLRATASRAGKAKNARLAD